MIAAGLSALASVLVQLQTASATVPDPDPISLPGPTGLLMFLLVFTFLLHLVPMNFVLGGSLLMVLSYARASMVADQASRNHRRLIEILARAFPPAIAFTITLGVAPLLFVQVLYGQLFFSSSILMAWPWLGVIGLLLVGYYAAYWHTTQHMRLGEVAAWVALLVAATFLVIAFVFVNNFSLLQNPEVWRSLYLSDRRGLHLYAVWESSVLPRYLHFLFAALGLTGLAVAAMGVRRRAREPEFARWAMGYGARWFIGGTLLQMGSGIWFIASQPARIRNALLGASPLDTLLLAVAIACALVAMGVLVPSDRISVGRLYLASAAIGVTVILMVILRQRIRTMWLDPFFRTEQLSVASQWGAILLFLILFLAGVLLVGWMLWQFFRSPSKALPQA